MLTQLREAPILSIQHEHNGLFHTQQMCKTCQENRFRPIKAKGLHLMLVLGDTKPSSSKEAREEQKAWVHLQGTEKLGIMWVVSYIASQGYDYSEMLKGRADDARRVAVRQVSQELRETLHPGFAQLPALEDVQVKAELQCVYHEMALRHGPFFIWASAHGTEPERQWVLGCLEQGLEELKLFEGGTAPQQQGLQAVIRNAILEKTSGQSGGFWMRVKDLIYDAMTSPESSDLVHDEEE